MKMLEEGESQLKIVQKRIKFEEDRISALPDCLLLEILSRLPDTKYAIRTSTLSKRWEDLWTLVPSLIFRSTDAPYGKWFYHALLVDKTLTQCRQLKLKKFQVYIIYDTRFESQVNNWIHYVISCNVEELNLEFCYQKESEFRLDQSSFFNSCFTDLRLVGCTLNPTGAICWKNLKSLCIPYVHLNEDLIVNILSGSPLLETLELKYSLCEAKINAPNSYTLTQCPKVKLKKFKVLSYFHIEFKSQFNSWIHYAIRCNVKELNLGFLNSYFKYNLMMLDQILFTSSCIAELALTGCKVNPVGAIRWKNLRSLSISCGILHEDIIESILSGSPVLETLMLENCYGYRRLNITSKNVKNLVFSQYCYVEEFKSEDVIEVNAPNILSLKIKGSMFLQKFLLLNVYSLVKADLNYSCKKTMRGSTKAEEEMLKGYIMNLGHVNEVKIGSLCYEAVSCLQAKGFIFPSNVKFHGARFENR